MDGIVEHEICANCKKEIPQNNYVMHTMHCARNITLCKECNEPIPKSQFEDHKKSCVKPVRAVKKPSPPPTTIENSTYFQSRKSVEDQKAAVRRDNYMKRHDRLVDTGYSLKSGHNSSISSSSIDTNTFRGNSSATVKSNDYKTHNGTTAKPANGAIRKQSSTVAPVSNQNGIVTATDKSKKGVGNNGLLACKFCELELPKLELEDHENYCGSRTDKCLECGELVMFKHKQVHLDTNHGFLKLKDEPGPRPSWDSATQRSTTSSITSTGLDSPVRRRFDRVSLQDFDFDPTPYLPSNYVPSSANRNKKKEGESYKEISRRLDCKTEYIRNLLHDSASITAPLRHNGAMPRNHFNHNKGPAPQPPHNRRRNPPTELVIPCEFCDVPVPHEELIQHETGCRPDLARYNPRRRSPVEDDEYRAAQQRRAEEDEELPCEFCSNMIPASQLLLHQLNCPT